MTPEDMGLCQIQISVIGPPAPQGSKSFKGMSKAGHAILVESSKAVKPWREMVKTAAMEALAGYQRPVFGGPVEAVMIFTVQKPKSAPKRRRTWPDRAPDLSKLVRSTEDALTQVGIWEDDARVVSCLSRKVFPGEDPDSLQVPGAIIRIRSARAGATASMQPAAEVPTEVLP